MTGDGTRPDYSRMDGDWSDYIVPNGWVRLKRPRGEGNWRTAKFTGVSKYGAVKFIDEDSGVTFSYRESVWERLWEDGELHVLLRPADF